MNTKGDILNAWIMVEHLSEGKMDNKKAHRFDVSRFYNLYALIRSQVDKDLKNKKRGGVIIWFEVFPFSEVIDILRKKYNLLLEEETVETGNKFSLALYFDKDMHIVLDMTYFTTSYYVRTYKDIPRTEEFIKYEEKQKEIISEWFRFSEKDKYEDVFNNAINEIIKRYNFSIDNCRYELLSNLENEDINLHSFFVSDLEKAKSCNSDLLNKYLLNKTDGERVNLDSNKKSEKFNLETFNNILQPQNYPVSRYPSNLHYALSFMQQVAVNLAVNNSMEKIKSVNGPPGTGKSTLLYDVIAELVTEQAFDIVKLVDKRIKGTYDTAYWENASLGCVPQSISEKNIVVVSSNHSAVKNIVDELPSIKKISEEFREELIEADYFYEISNSKVNIRWSEDNQGNKNRALDKTRLDNSEIKWGIFSFEGGRKDNMESLITVLEHIVDNLENEYISDVDVYNEFEKKYTEITDLRNRIQREAVKIEKLEETWKELVRVKSEFNTKRKEKKAENDKKISINKAEIENLKTDLLNIEHQNAEYTKQLTEFRIEKETINQYIGILKKPGLFSSRRVKKEYKQQLHDYISQISSIYEEECNLKKLLNNNDHSKYITSEEIGQYERDNKKIENEYEEWIIKTSKVIEHLELQVDEIKKQINSTIEKRKNDFSLSYKELQLSNPWFDQDYRMMQSSLFIAAIKVRKQFLYDNVKNIKTAIHIWRKQKKYAYNKQLIKESWNWINTAIPVIGSTFASISRMFSFTDSKCIGYLLIDEAGQALPQASVGAIFRSNRVMAVGDPSQIKPVLTLDPSVLNLIRKKYMVSESFLSENASTQSIIDSISKYGFYKDEEDWMGIPLWVHRRCKSPMFDISNRISYNGNMVQELPKDMGRIPGKAEWYDIKGVARDKYVEEQGEFLKNEILSRIKDKDNIFVISPFKNVAFHLSIKLKEIGYTKYENGKPVNVGTVHTFQGKEAKIVYLVLGADERSKGAANWAMGTANPNIMNVAATRAKEEFYIIGDKKLYSSLGSNVVDSTLSLLAKFHNNRG